VRDDICRKRQSLSSHYSFWKAVPEWMEVHASVHDIPQQRFRIVVKVSLT
jgi:hypothetical protein